MGNTKVVVKAVEKEPEEVQATLSATQAGASKITITSNKDLSADTLSVKKGTTAVKVTSTEFTSDGKSATLVLENKIVAADYTVAASNAAINANFTGEVSKLASIDFTSDYAIVDGELGIAKTAYTYYIAKNQWEEDVTSTTSLVANSSAPTTTAAKGKITFDYGSTALTAASLNNPLTVVVYDSTTAVTAQKTLKISNKALVATIEPYGTDGIYNANGKSLAVADKYTESFYYLFRAQDQYGNYLDDASKMTQSNGFYVSYSAGLTNLGTGTLTTKEINGVTYFAIPLVMNNSLQPGTATLILVAGGSGKSVNAQIKVNDGNTVNTITVTAPTTVAFGDNNVKFDYTALDAEGNTVTSYAQLSKLTISPAGSPSSYGFYWSKVNGKAVLCFNTTGTNSPLKNPTTSLGEVVTATFLTTTYKSSMVTFNVKQQRYPAEIVGLADKVANAQLVGRDLELNVGDFKVVDQYGDAFDMKNQPYGIQAKSVLGSAFRAAGTNGTPAYYKKSSAADINDPAYTSNDLAIAQSASGKATSFNLTATNAGEETYEFKLVAHEASGYVTLKNTVDATTKDITELGSKKITLTATANSKFVRYEVESPKTLYVTNDKDFNGTTGDIGTPAEFEPSITVYGIDNTGAKVKLTIKDYQISGGTNVNVSSTGKLSAAITTEAAYNKDFAVKDATLAGNFSVTMNDGTVEKVDITLSNSAPSVASLALIDGKTYLAPTVAIDADEILKNVKGKDNYGFDVKWDNTKLAFYGNKTTALTTPTISPLLTVSDFVYAGSVVPSNGTSNPDFTQIVAGDKFTVTVAAGSASLAIPVVPEASAYTATANAAAKSITDAMTGQTVSLATDNVSDAASLKAALEAKHATVGYTVTVTITAEPTSYAAAQTGTYTVTIKNTTTGGTSTTTALTVTLAS